MEKLQAFERSISTNNCWLQDVFPARPSLSPSALFPIGSVKLVTPQSHRLWLLHWYLLCYPNIWPQSRPWTCFNYMDCALECCPCFLSNSTPALFLARLYTLSSVPISCTSPFCYVTNTETVSKPKQIRLYKLVKEPDITGTLIAVRNYG